MRVLAAFIELAGFIAILIALLLIHPSLAIGIGGLAAVLVGHALGRHE